jgi:hypothetical protein
MPVSINNTTLTFNDATTQTTSGVTSVGVSTGLSSTGGKTPTLTNTGVTSLTGAGTVSVSASTGAITITGTGGGTVTSVATGNGLSGGTITSTGTLVLACPAFNTVGSYCTVGDFGSFSGVSWSSGSNYSAGTGLDQFISIMIFKDQDGGGMVYQKTNNLSGTWKWMSGTYSQGGLQTFGLACRVS